jgi:hypothetical protein
MLYPLQPRPRTGHHEPVAEQGPQRSAAAPPDSPDDPPPSVVTHPAGRRRRPRPSTPGPSPNSGRHSGSRHPHDPVRRPAAHSTAPPRNDIRNDIETTTSPTRDRGVVMVAKHTPIRCHRHSRGRRSWSSTTTACGHAAARDHKTPAHHHDQL